MQIDFHHTATYVIARYAGFAHRDAETVAYCAQYVDDATNGDRIKFDNGAMYDRISSAHKMLDYRNFSSLANHYVWIPFHFLPGNGGKAAGENPSSRFIDKIICRPNSPIAQEMVRDCILEQDAAYGLHRLGVTMHVYADSWAHQGFAGVQHECNTITMLKKDETTDQGFADRIKRYFNRAASEFVGDALPLGHGAALSHPDQPYLQWSYRDYRGKIIKRDNTRDFLEAAHEMCKAMQRYRVRDPDARVPGLSAEQKRLIRNMLKNTRHEGGEERHQIWLQAIANGEFGFPAQGLAYRGKGRDSWKYQAIGTEKDIDDEDEIFPYSHSFLDSDWKHFHDALQVHRLTVIRDILPRHGISAA